MADEGKESDVAVADNPNGMSWKAAVPTEAEIDAAKIKAQQDAEEVNKPKPMSVVDWVSNFLGYKPGDKSPEK